MILTHIIDPSSFSDKELAKHISTYLFQSEDIKNEDLFHLLRFIVTGKKSGPNITEACGLIGQDKITERISRFSML
jgi:glutamyl/glutaminyl-tRNA synthetase